MTERNQTFPNIWQAALIVIAMRLFELMAYGVVVGLLGPQSASLAGAGAVTLLLSYGLTFAALLGIKQLHLADVLHPSSNSATATIGLLTLPLAMLVPALVLVMFAVEAVLTFVVPLSPEQEAMFKQIASPEGTTMLTVCVLAPIFEEMLFRGVMLRSFLLQYPRSKAMWLSAIVFGAAHLNIYQFAAATLLGWLLAWLYERTHSLWPGILLHAMYNTSVVWLQQAFGDIQDSEPLPAILALPFWMGAFACAFVGSTLIRRALVRKQ